MVRVLLSTWHVFQWLTANLKFIYPSLHDGCKQSIRMNKHYLILALLSAVELSQTYHGSVQFSWAELSAVELSLSNTDPSDLH